MCDSSALFNSLFIILTPFFTSLLDCGYPGLSCLRTATHLKTLIFTAVKLVVLNVWTREHKPSPLSSYVQEAHKLWPTWCTIYLCTPTRLDFLCPVLGIFRSRFKSAITPLGDSRNLKWESEDWWEVEKATKLAVHWRRLCIWVSQATCPVFTVHPHQQCSIKQLHPIQTSGS